MSMALQFFKSSTTPISRSCSTSDQLNACDLTAIDLPNAVLVDRSFLRTHGLCQGSLLPSVARQGCPSMYRRGIATHHLNIFVMSSDCLTVPSSLSNTQGSGAEVIATSQSEAQTDSAKRSARTKRLSTVASLTSLQVLRHWNLLRSHCYLPWPRMEGA